MGQISLPSCDRMRELFSASLDGELSELDDARLQAHSRVNGDDGKWNQRQRGVKHLLARRIAHTQRDRLDRLSRDETQVERLGHCKRRQLLRHQVDHERRQRHVYRAG